MKATAEQLGNTPSICRKCYVHPGILDAYLDHSLQRFLRQYHDREKQEVRESLKPKEARVLAFLHQLSAN
jgi:DNA topoisomerase-1